MSSLKPRVSVIIPARSEGAEVTRVLDRLLEEVRLPCEVLVVVDSDDDPTAAVVRAYAASEPRLRLLVSGYDPGPANAIRYGIDAAVAPVAVVTMADGCDDPRQIDDLVRLVERGVAVAAASRYMAGGQQVGGPFLKGLMSRVAGRSLYLFARVGTRDATNSFKAYSTEFIKEVGVDSRGGFEIGIELTAKAKRLRRPVAEVPTIWLDRHAGVSNFRIILWIPKYMRWYRFAFGRRLTPRQIRAVAAAAPDDLPVRRESPPAAGGPPARGAPAGGPPAGGRGGRQPAGGPPAAKVPAAKVPAAKVPAAKVPAAKVPAAKVPSGQPGLVRERKAARGV